MSAKNKPVKKVTADDKQIKSSSPVNKSTNKTDSAETKRSKAPQAAIEPIPPQPVAKRVIAAIPFAVAVILFLMIWTENKTEVLDPWYAAVRLVDSSKNVTDAGEKTRLLEEGGAKLRDLLVKHPYHARVHFFMGYYFFMTQKWDSAIIELCETVRMDTLSTVNPIWIDAVNLLGAASINKSNEFLKQNKLTEALPPLKFARLYNPNNKDVNHNIAVIYHNTGNLDSAIFYYEYAFQADQNNTQLRQNMSNAYFFKGNQAMVSRNVKQAAEYFKRAAEINPENKAALQNAAMAFEMLGDQTTASVFKKQLANN